MIVKEYIIDVDGNQIEITFDDLQIREVDRVEHSIFYECLGWDNFENSYSGVAEFTCDEFEQITDIEKI